MRTEDGHLICQCLNGDQTAFGFLVAKYKEPVYASAYAKVGNFADAQDLTQEVFIRAYQNLRSLKHYDRFRSWLYAICANLCKNFLQSKASRAKRESAWSIDPKAYQQLTLQAHRQKQTYERLYEALEELPDIYREVLSLKYLGGMKSREIAQLLGTSVTNINARLSRARSLLKGEMIAMMSTTFDSVRLQPGFTFRVVEALKQTKIGETKLIPEQIIKKQIGQTLTGTDFLLGKKYKGKVRDVYEDKGKVFLISTDRQSAFDRSLAHIPFKGQVLTQTSAFWFEQTKDIVQNHIIDVPDPNVVVGKKLTVFPVEMVIRGYLTGVTETAAWTAYAKRERLFCGNVLPEGMQKNQKFPESIITPTTKDEVHDEKISAEEIVEQALMTQEQWDYVADKTRKIFQRGQEIAAKKGLILVDTKYEFGYDDEGNIYLLDEIHTPDSSRFWLKESYEQRFSEGKEPENIDKEFLRLWFKENSDPYNDDVLPDAPEELVVELSKRYIQLFEMITGQAVKAEPGDVKQRIEHNLKEKGYM